MTTKSGVRFFILASKDPFFAPQITENGRFRVQKIGSSDARIKKRTPLFCPQVYPKMVDETLVSYEYHYWVSFGQILKMAYLILRLIFGRFPLIKSQNQKPYGAIAQFLR